MKKLLMATAVLVSTTAFAQHSLEKIWQSDSTLKTPESVLFDPVSKTLFVANIGDMQKEKTGFISKMDINGKIVNRDWVTGLTATKGMGLYNNKLYASELTAVAVIDVNSGTISERIPVEGAQFLNDITIDSKGIVYVSDSRTGKIHRIENGKPTVFLENLKNPNGLLSIGTDLYVLADGSVMKVDATKTVSTLVQAMEGNSDGIEMVQDGEFIVTSWQGIVYYVKTDGSKAVLLDTRDQKSNTADIGYDRTNRIVYVPTFAKNTVVAYKLN